MGQNRTRYLLAALPLALLAACVEMPTGPSVAVMPAAGKPLEVFSAEDQACRAYANQSIGGTTGAEAAAAGAAGTAAIGTVVGAAAGALIGGHNGAGAGAGMGLVAGSAIGANQGAYAGASLQRRYDIAYQQCMYAKGNALPTAGYYVRRGYGYSYVYPTPAPAPAAPPPPPPPPQ